MRDWVVRHDAPEVILCDGDSTLNSAAWAAARFYRAELADDDEELDRLLRRLTSEETIPIGEVGYHLRRAPQLLLLNRLRLGRFTYPDLIVLLEIDPEVALERIRATREAAAGARDRGLPRGARPCVRTGLPPAREAARDRRRQASGRRALP